LRRRLLAVAYPREVRALVSGSASTFARAAGVRDQTDAQLDATLGVVRDELAWLWATIATGALLDGGELAAWDSLVTLLPSGAPLPATEASAAERPVPPGRRGAARVAAERTALALGQTLATCVRERAARLAAAGVLGDAQDAEHLTWDELLAPPDDAAIVIERRRAEHERLVDVRLPDVVSAVGPASAVQTTTTPREKALTP
jgi:hypothetical protein